jgi:hypothetical protein
MKRKLLHNHTFTRDWTQVGNLIARSNPGPTSSTGVTRANFISSGKTPEDKDRLMIFVIGCKRRSANYKSKKVGMGSRSEDFTGQDFNSEATSATLTLP